MAHPIIKALEQKAKPTCPECGAELHFGEVTYVADGLHVEVFCDKSLKHEFTLECGVFEVS